MKLIFLSSILMKNRPKESSEELIDVGKGYACLLWQAKTRQRGYTHVLIKINI